MCFEFLSYQLYTISYSYIFFSIHMFSFLYFKRGLKRENSPMRPVYFQVWILPALLGLFSSLRQLLPRYSHNSQQSGSLARPRSSWHLAEDGPRANSSSIEPCAARHHKSVPRNTRVLFRASLIE